MCRVFDNYVSGFCDATLLLDIEQWLRILIQMFLGGSKIEHWEERD